MKSIIDELYYENLSLSQLMPISKAEKDLTAEHLNTVDALRRTLGRKQAKRLDAILDQTMRLTASETKDYFHMGFCLGARFMREILEFPGL